MLSNSGFAACHCKAGGQQLNITVRLTFLWNTVYLDLAIKALQENGEKIPHHLIPHLAPLGWEHIILTGDINWQFTLSENTDGYLPLRIPNIGVFAA